ncbi:MAG: protein kinase, partial [Gemmataceae bacterium]
MTIDSVDSLIEQLRDSGLLDSAQLEELSRLSAVYGDPRVLARELMERGWLTPYQVNQLFQTDRQQLVLGPYILLEKLGSGGMGQVFKARHKLMKRIVALKVIRKDRLGDANAVNRFLREIEASAQLAHPNIVTAYDADQVGDTLLLAMEYVQGTDLSRMVKQNGPLPIEQACAYARQAALALQHAHERGLVHRDIKPHNLLVSFTEGKVKVLDMGLARLHGSVSDAETSEGLTQTGAVMGTPDYISPEQARHARVDIRSDIYSLGCSLYHMLTGRVPFTGKSLTEKLLSHQLDIPEPIDRIRPEIPLELGLVVERMMAKKPEERYQTPGEAAHALEPFGYLPGRGAITLKMPGSSSEVLLSSVGRARQAPADLKELVVTARSAVRRHPRRILIGLGGLALFIALVLWLGLSDVKNRIPPQEQFSWQPKELVMVLGEHRLRHAYAIRRVAYSPNGKLLATCSTTMFDMMVRVFDAQTRQEYRVLEGHKDEVRCIAFAGDSRTLISAGEDNVIKVWDVQSGNEVATLYGHKGIINDLCFARDGRTFASASQDGTVRLWTLNVPTSKHLFEVKGQATGVAISRDGTLAVAVQKDNTTAFIQLFSLLNGAEIGVIEDIPPGSLQSLRISKDGRYLAFGHSSATVKVWELPGRTEYASISAYQGNALDFSFTGDLLAIGGAIQGQVGEILLWNIPEKQEVGRLDGNMRQVACVAFSPDRVTLASGSFDGLLQLWDLPNRKERTPLQGYRFAMRSVAFSPDGRSILAGDDEGGIHLWDLDTLKDRNHLQLVRQRRGVGAVDFSNDGTIMATGDQTGTVRLWDVDTLQTRATMSDFQDFVRRIRFGPDNQTVLVADRSRVLLRELPSRRVLDSVAKGGPMYTIAHSADTRRAAYAFTDRVQIFDVKSGAELISITDVNPRGPL